MGRTEDGFHPGRLVVDYKLASGDRGVSLLPVSVEDRPAVPSVTVLMSPAPPSPPLIQGHIELEVLGARLKLHGDVDAQRLRIVLDALARRP